MGRQAEVRDNGIVHVSSTLPEGEAHADDVVLGEP